KHGVPGLQKDPPFIAAAQGPTKVAPPSDQTVSTSSDAGATLLHDNGKPAAVKVVNSEEQPVDLNAQGSANNPPPASAPANSSAGTTDPALAAIINSPLVPPQPAAPPKGMTSEFPEPKPARTISLRPDGTPIGAVSAQTRIANQAFTTQVIGPRGGRQNRYDRSRGDRADAGRPNAECPAGEA